MSIYHEVVCPEHPVSEEPADVCRVRWLLQLVRDLLQRLVFPELAEIVELGHVDENAGYRDGTTEIMR